MKSKFVSLILSLAVIAGLMLVPAALPVGPAGVVLASSNVTISVQPALTAVGCGGAYALTVVVDNPDQVPVSIAAARLDFDTTCIGVTSIAAGDLPITVLNTYDNGNGTIDFDGGMPMGANTTSSSILVCTINCVAPSAPCGGISAIDFVYVGGPPPRQTKVEFGATDYLESGNMSLMTGATVKCGAPELTVDVSPAGKGTVSIDSGVPPTVYPDYSNRTWDEVVDLDAIPVAGWEWDSWTGTDNDGVNPTTVTMDTDESVVAVFTELPCDLDVDPNTVPQLKARYAATGGNEDSDTVTISNLGGGTLCWMVGYPPTWTVNDTWSYWNSYDEAPPGSPFPNPLYNPALPCPVQNTMLDLVVTGETASSYLALADWPMADPQRADSAGVPVCMQDASVVVNKCSMDYASMLANLTIYMGPPPGLAAQVLVTYAYDGCHGWPYYVGKTWTYNMTIVKPAPMPTVVLPAQSMVTAGPMPDPIGAGFTDCYEITSATPNMAGTVFMQQYWSDTAGNYVYQWDGGTFLAPPLDQRIFQGMVTAPTSAPACCAAPSWLSFNKVSGSLGIGGSEVLTVTANTSGLAVGTYNGSFCVSSCCGSVEHECVNVSLWVQPATTLTDLVRVLPPDALDFDAEYPGDSFFVYVNFTSLGDDFNSIGVTDYAPPGWLVETKDIWCVPPASYNKSNYNKAEYAWAGPYNSTQTFSAKYKVTIPATANPGSNFWPECSAMPCPPCGGSPIENYPAWVDYWIGPDGPFETMICDDREKVVTVPGCVTGETRDVLGNVLDTVTVDLYENDDVWEDQDTSSIVGSEAVYQVCADDTGMYYLWASKYCYFSLNTRPTGDGGDMPSSRNPAYPDYIDFSTPELLAAGNVTDFVGDYGLVCRAASLSMAMEAVNHMLFTPEEPLGTPHPDWKLSGWKVTQVVNSWQFPAGCACC